MLRPDDFADFYDIANRSSLSTTPLRLRGGDTLSVRLPVKLS